MRIMTDHLDVIRNLPLYARLADGVRADILEGRLKPGDRLPTEAELSRIHEVSRITVRQALDVLRQRGLIERFSGRGSFVTTPADSVAWTIDSIDDIIRLSAQTHILGWKPVPAPATVAKFFGNPGERVYRLRGVRERGGIPIHYIEVYAPFGLGRRLDREDLVQHTVVNLIETKLRLPITGAMEEVSAQLAGAAIARHLRVPVGSPLLVQEIKFFGLEHRPLECLRVWWRADQFKRRMELARSR